MTIKLAKKACYIVLVIFLVSLITGCRGYSKPTPKEKEKYDNEALQTLKEKYDEEFMIVDSYFYSNMNGAWGYNYTMSPKNRPEITFRYNSVYDGYMSGAWAYEARTMIEPIMKEEFGEDIDFRVSVIVPPSLYDYKVKGGIPTFMEALEL